MKKIISTLLLAALTVTVSAAPVFKARLDVHGGKVALKAVSCPNKGYFKNIHWGKKENRKYNLTGETTALPVGKWVKVSFSFIPEADGKVTINLMSNWSKTKGKKGLNAHWVYYDMVTSEGAEVKNGDFENAKGGKPVAWSCAKNQYVTGELDFVSGKAAVKAWHNRRCAQRITVKKGQKVTITVNAKAGKLEAAKK
jgi:hypothetical protein